MPFPNLLVLLMVVQCCILVSCKKHIISAKERYSVAENKSTILPMIRPIYKESVEVSEVYQGNSQYFQCSSWGIFPNLNDTKCRTYFFCYLQWENLTFTKRKFQCPTTSYFNPTLLICDNNYKCARQTTHLNTIINNSPISNEIEGTSCREENCRYNNNSDYLKCTASGKYPNLSDNYCRTYYRCKRHNNNWRKRKYRCSRHTYYNPSTQTCESNYKCPCTGTNINIHHTSISTSEESSSEESNYNSSSDDSSSDISSSESISTEYRGSGNETCIYHVDSKYVHCVSKGKYPNPYDASCRTYFNCILKGRGSFIQRKSKCSRFTFFNPWTQSCDRNYKCPSNATQISSIMSSENIKDKYMYHIDSKYFKCTSKGRFPNHGDTSCQTYFLCLSSWDGGFIQRKYKCLSFYNPETQKCDKHYDCPYNVTKIVTASKLSELSGPVRYPSSYESNASKSTTPKVIINYNCVYSKYFNNFRCSSRGRFPNLNDLTCQTYFYCAPISNGNFTKIEYNCSKLSYYNPSTQSCERNYKCPCTTSLSTDSSVITTPSSNSLQSYLNKSKTRFPSTASEDLVTSFSCTSKGRFPNQNDSTCKTYFICKQINGQLVKDLSTCPNLTYFHPSYRLCMHNYNCSSRTISLTTSNPVTATQTTLKNNELSSSTKDIVRNNEETQYFQCLKHGRYPNVHDCFCKTYFRCDLREDGSFSKGNYICPDKHNFNPSLQICDSNYKCKTWWNISTTSLVNLSGKYEEMLSTTPIYENICVYHNDSNYFTCKRGGVYPNRNEPSCNSYFICSLLTNGTLIKTKYFCPIASYYNPQRQVCDAGYKCPCHDKKFANITTQKSITAGQIEIITQSIFTTTIRDNLTTIVSSNIGDYEKDPFSSIVNSEATTCTENCAYQKDPEYFVCKEKGRYLNLNDLTCNSYFLCNLLRNGSFIKTKYSCPETSLFNPQQQLCDVDFNCPCSTNKIDITTTVKSITTEDIEIPNTSTFKLTSHTNSASTTHILSSSATSTATTSSDICVYQEDPNYFVCKEKGRYPNLNDLTCTSYFLCNLMRNGSFIKTIYSCPETSFFNPKLQLCDVDFNCPCSTDQIDITATGETTTTGDIENPNTSTSKLTSHTNSASTTHILSSSATSTATTSSDICVYQEDPNYFVCKEKGRYPNLNDLTCTSYFLCNLMRNGSFIKTIYSCPETSFFNPKLQLCDVDFNCPCSTDQIDITATGETTTTGDIENPNTSTSKLTCHTNFASTTHILSSSATSTATTSSDICVYQEDPNYFVCKEKGRYPNLNDLTCTSYFLCNLMRNGSFIKTIYSCPETSFFSPKLQFCDVDFNCPCSTDQIDITATGETTTTGDIENPNTSTSKLTSHTNFASTTHILSSSATSTATTSSDICVYQEDPNYFVCKEKGRYPNLNDLTCTSYFLCNLLRNGSFIKTKYSCPETSLFNPQQQLCDVDYNCSCSTNKIDITTTVKSITTEDIEIPNTSTFKLTNHTNSASTTHILSSSATSTATTSSDICVYQEDPNYFVCKEKGRYPNLNDLTCTSYFLCNLMRNGSLIKTIYSCPETSFFNPKLQLCDVDFNCPCSTDQFDITTTGETTTTEDIENSNTSTSKLTSHTNFASTTHILSSSATSTATTSSDVCVYQEDPNYFVCKEKGRYPNLNDLTCTSYFLCNLMRNGSFIKTIYSCPETSFFNPKLQFCDVDFNCPCSTDQIDITATGETTTTGDIENPNTSTFKLTSHTNSASTTHILSSSATSTATTSSDICVYQEDPNYFVCKEIGRYPNFNDLTCTSYFLCNLMRNGSFIKTIYSCPETSFFNPKLQLCDVDFNCPCSTDQFDITTTGETTTTEDIENPNTSTSKLTTHTNSASTTHILSSSATSTATTSSDICVYQEDPNYFVCKEKGRYPNLNDLTCTSYFLCNLLRNGSFIKTKYSCPETSLFNPQQQLCDVDYNCSCSTNKIDITTTVKSITTEDIEIPNTSTFKLTSHTNSASTTHILSSSATSTATTSSDICVYQEDPNYFVCKEKGRYPNLNDLTCTSYFLCNLMRNGSFIKTIYSCPETSFFNPKLQLCDVDFNCPCSTDQFDITTTGETTTTEDIENSNTSTSKLTSHTNSASTTHILSSSATSTATTSSDICVYQEDPNYFVCKEKGRYPNLNDLTCTSYFLCNLMRNGSFIKTIYSCPETSFFNPKLQLCDVDFNCPCSTDQIDITATGETTTTGDIENPNTSTSKLTSHTNFASTTHILSSSATSTATTSSDICVYQEDPNYFVCKEKGRYPNLNDLTCTSYFLCNLMRNGSFIKTKYSCPETSFFNPKLQLCDVDFNCPCSTDQFDITTTGETSTTDVDFNCPCSTDKFDMTTTGETTTTDDIENPNTSTSKLNNHTNSASTTHILSSSATSTATTSSDICVYQEDPNYFVCKEKGRYPNFNDLTCTSYFLCNLLRNGSFIKTKYSCPKTSFFNPPRQVCDINYKCPCDTELNGNTTIEEQTDVITASTSIFTKPSNSETTTYPEDCVYQKDPDYFLCTQKGRYPNLNDPTCTSYFLCNLLRNGSFIKTKYSCPKTSFFNPPRQLCDIDYKCPCSAAQFDISIQ